MSKKYEIVEYPSCTDVFIDGTSTAVATFEGPDAARLARLFAAAEEMREAIDYAIQRMDDEPCVAQLRAALALADGRGE